MEKLRKRLVALVLCAFVLLGGCVKDEGDSLFGRIPSIEEGELRESEPREEGLAKEGSRREERKEEREEVKKQGVTWLPAAVGEAEGSLVEDTGWDYTEEELREELWSYLDEDLRGADSPTWLSIRASVRYGQDEEGRIGYATVLQQYSDGSACSMNADIEDMVWNMDQERQGKRRRIRSVLSYMPGNYYSSAAVWECREQGMLKKCGWDETELYHFNFYSNALRGEEFLAQAGDICRRVLEEENYYSPGLMECREYGFHAWVLDASPLKLAVVSGEMAHILKYSTTQEKLVYMDRIGGGELWEAFPEEEACYLGTGRFEVEEGAIPEFDTSPEAQQNLAIWRQAVESWLAANETEGYGRVEIMPYQDIWPRLWAKVDLDLGGEENSSQGISFYRLYSYGSWLGECIPGLVSEMGFYGGRPMLEAE